MLQKKLEIKNGATFQVLLDGLYAQINADPSVEDKISVAFKKINNLDTRARAYNSFYFIRGHHWPCFFYNFNEAGCNNPKISPCQANHTCLFCREKHPANRCPGKPFFDVIQKQHGTVSLELGMC